MIGVALSPSPNTRCLLMRSTVGFLPVEQGCQVPCKQVISRNSCDICTHGHSGPEGHRVFSFLLEEYHENDPCRRPDDERQHQKDDSQPPAQEAPSMRPRVAPPQPMPPLENRIISANRPAPIAAPPAAPTRLCHPASAPKTRPMAVPGKTTASGPRPISQSMLPTTSARTVMIANFRASTIHPKPQPKPTNNRPVHTSVQRYRTPIRA